jgi:hypothetical protein
MRAGDAAGRTGKQLAELYGHTDVLARLRAVVVERVGARAQHQDPAPPPWVSRSIYHWSDLRVIIGIRVFHLSA